MGNRYFGNETFKTIRFSTLYVIVTILCPAREHCKLKMTKMRKSVLLRIPT